MGNLSAPVDKADILNRNYREVPPGKKPSGNKNQNTNEFNTDKGNAKQSAAIINLLNPMNDDRPIHITNNPKIYKNGKL